MNIISCRQTFCFSYIPHKITSKSWIKKFLLVLCQRLRHSYSILLLCLLNKTPFIKHKLLRLQLIKESLQLPQLFQKIILRRCSTAARSGYAVGLSYIEPDVSTGRLLSLTHNSINVYNIKYEKVNLFCINNFITYILRK